MNTEYPFVSILIPAHNEELVIEDTIESMLNLDYPNYEIIVINDNSTDKTAEILNKYKNRIRILNTNSNGKGKSFVLNYGLEFAKGDLICIYDADNQVDSKALSYLVAEINSGNYTAVTGQFKARNAEFNLLTRLIEIETAGFQLLYQAGRSLLFNRANLPGTNFIIKKDILNKHGWGDCLAEDTELSLRLFQAGKKIGYTPKAISWQQSVQTLSPFFRQRARWSRGNFQIIFKYLKQLNKCKNIKFEIFYMITTYLFFLSAVIILDLIFILLLFSNFRLNMNINLIAIWILAYILYISQNALVLLFDKGDRLKKFMLIGFSYFSYSQLWISISLKAFMKHFQDLIYDNEVRWYKTERF